ncbi:MAG: hypothetical protein Aurels2KO_38080 [Aureliella sp.]
MFIGDSRIQAGDLHNPVDCYFNQATFFWAANQWLSATAMNSAARRRGLMPTRKLQKPRNHPQELDPWQGDIRVQ